MNSLHGWQLGFLGLVMGASLLVTLYTEARRLLWAAVDDRYGAWARFWWEAHQPESARSGVEKARFAVAFFFCYGLHDLWRLITLVAFDLFVVFAILAPFWRHVYFEDVPAMLAVTIGVAGTAVFLYIRVRQSVPLCRLHEWTGQVPACARCGEAYVEMGPSSRISWHGFWQRQVSHLTEPPEPFEARSRGA